MWLIVKPMHCKGHLILVISLWCYLEIEEKNFNQSLTKDNYVLDKPNIL